MASIDDIKNRYIEELLGSTTVFDTIESAAVAEAWASGAVAEWRVLGGGVGKLAKRILPTSLLGASLIDWMEGGSAPSDGPDWVGDIDRHELLRIVRLGQASQGDEVGWILEYMAPSGARHDLSVTSGGGALVGLAIGPEGLADTAFEDDAHGLRVEVLADHDEALAEIRQCLDTISLRSVSGEATLPLLVHRLGMSEDKVEALTPAERNMPERDADDDVWCAGVLSSSLRTLLSESRPESVDSAQAAVASLIAAGDPDISTVFEVAGLDLDAPLDSDLHLRLVGAYLAPKNLGAHTDPQFAALVELEPVDWVGAILGVSRSAPGTPVDGDALVRFINRAPELTSTIPASDAPRIAWTFEQMLYAWRVCGVLDEDGAVSDAARWLLPRAALVAWGHHADRN